MSRKEMPSSSNEYRLLHERSRPAPRTRVQSVQRTAGVGFDRKPAGTVPLVLTRPQGGRSLRRPGSLRRLLVIPGGIALAVRDRATFVCQRGEQDGEDSNLASEEFVPGTKDRGPRSLPGVN